MDYEAALAERDARLAEFEGLIVEAAKPVGAAEKLRQERDEPRRQDEERRVSFEPTIAGAENVEVATALFLDFGSSIEKLKAAEQRSFWPPCSDSTVATDMLSAGAQ